MPLWAGSATWLVRDQFRRRVTRPILDYPSTVDLGERERGDIAIARFAISNRGQAELLIDHFSTSCACAGVEHEVNGRWERVESASVPPGGQLQLAVRLAVSALPGDGQFVRVLFPSNDLSQPIGKIDVIVSYIRGGVYPFPSAVLFGEVRVGSKACRVIDLYDNRQAGRRIAIVRSTKPDRFSVRVVPRDESEPAPKNERGGSWLARVEITAKTNQPGPLRGAIELARTEESRPPDLIPVYGDVVQDIECRPGALILPRRVGEHFVDSSQVLLRHRDGKPFDLEIKDVPQGLSAKIRPMPDGDFPWLLEIECHGPRPAIAGEQIISLRGHCTGIQIPINVTALRMSFPTPAGQSPK